MTSETIHTEPDVVIHFQGYKLRAGDNLPLQELVVDKLEDNDPLYPKPQRIEFMVENKTHRHLENVRIITNLPDGTYEPAELKEGIEPYGMRQGSLILYPRKMLESTELPDMPELIVLYKEMIQKF